MINHKNNREKAKTLALYIFTTVCYISFTMITVIIAGGSGTRLWPLSTPDYPKHLLKINGDKNSLLQNTYERVKDISSEVFVVTDNSHAKHVQEQLPALKSHNFIIEPARRGTASCVVAGLAHIGRHAKDDEPIAFVAADHYIRDKRGFSHSFNIAQEATRKHKKVVLVGVEPDAPATGFGYIEKGGLFDEASLIFNVKGFREKPEFDIAQQYLKSGNYLWNCGYFVGTRSVFLDAMQKYAPNLRADHDSLQQATTPKAYKDTYLGFEDNSIDYALIEKND